MHFFVTLQALILSFEQLRQANTYQLNLRYIPYRIGGSTLLLSWGIHMNYGEVLHNLLHLLKLEESGEAAFA